MFTVVHQVQQPVNHVKQAGRLEKCGRSKSLGCQDLHTRSVSPQAIETDETDETESRGLCPLKAKSWNGHRGRYSRNTSTGQWASRTTRSATEPIINRAKPVRPCEGRTIKSISCSWANRAISSAGFPKVTSK